MLARILRSEFPFPRGFLGGFVAILCFRDHPTRIVRCGRYRYGPFSLSVAAEWSKRVTLPLYDGVSRICGSFRLFLSVSMTPGPRRIGMAKDEAPRLIASYAHPMGTATEWLPDRL